MKKLVLALVLTLMSFVSVQAQSVDVLVEQKSQQLQAFEAKINAETIVPAWRKKAMLDTLRDHRSELKLLASNQANISELFEFEVEVSKDYDRFMQEILRLREQRIKELQRQSQPQSKSFWRWF